MDDSAKPNVLAASVEEDPAGLVGGWLDNENLTYISTESGGFVLAFEADNVSRIDIQMNFSDEFIRFFAPIGFLPEDIDANFFFDIIDLTGPIPMVKPMIDETRLFLLAIDLPLTAMSEEEVISDIAMLVEFVDGNYNKLHPWTEDE